jgi:hypothetical protein
MDDYTRVLRDVRDRHGLGDGEWGEFRTETGHFMALAPPDQGGEWRHGIRPQYTLHVKHPGDPFGSWFISGLGSDPGRVSENMGREFRHPDVMRHMGDQMSRAELDGDPHGQRSRGGPGQWADSPSAVFSHYE